MKKKFGIVTLSLVLALAGCTGEKGNNMQEQLTQNNLLEEKAEQGVTSTPVPTIVQEETTPETEMTPEAGTTSESDTAEEEPQVYVISFEANTMDGEEWNSDRMENARLTMVNVWATYCNPCLSEMPDLGELAAEYDAVDFQLIGIVSDVLESDSEENIGYVKELVEETKAAYPHLLLNESLYINLVGAVDAVPTTFFFNQDRELLGYVTGARSKEVWKDLIDRLLAELE